MSVIEIIAGSTIGILNKLPLIIKGKSSKNKVYAFLHLLSPVNKEGKYLVIHTSHEMYQTSDGYNHQANVTIQVDTETMTITDSFTKVMNK